MVFECRYMICGMLESKENSWVLEHDHLKMSWFHHYHQIKQKDGYFQYPSPLLPPPYAPTSFHKDSSPSPPSSSSGSRISPALLFIIVILAVLFFISGLLHLLVRFLTKHPPSSTSSQSNRYPEISTSDALQRQLQQLFHLHDSGGTLFTPGFSMENPMFEFDEIREDEGLHGQKTMEIEEIVVDKGVLPVRLGKFKRLDGQPRESLGETSSSNLDARRCFSMGSYQYVLGASDLRVTLSYDKRHGCGFKPSVEGKKISSASKGESFSVSKIWLWSKKGKLSTSSSDEQMASAQSAANIRCDESQLKNTCATAILNPSRLCSVTNCVGYFIG
ncbi:RING-H2 finger protein ATL46 isoform X4 [Gossypium hirsutum]|uniref:RING-type E3 ubiquitin transferase n=1 Tax=Gossypium hirsutum TaxID=3635 RepID=A0ABM3ARV0_GOSHI|nr:RING-H2 finger protein ATL46 isoform X4 [Gossypium hirsutum]